MPIFKQKLSKQTKIQIAAAILVVIITGGYVLWDVTKGGPITQFFSNPEEMRTWIEKQGPLGPLAFILLQFVQTVVAPIPGNVVGILGGYLFGIWGMLWSLIGSAAGFLMVFWLSRKLGRPLVEKVVSKEMLKKFDFVFSKRGPFILFLIFLIPGLPDDVVCYIAGLTEIPISSLMVMVLVGRLPALVANNLIGSGLGEGNYIAVVVFSVIIAILIAIIYLKQEKIINLLGFAAKHEKVIDNLEHNIRDVMDDGVINDSIDQKKPKTKRKS
ncbi:MAG: TVP38/TMEM64 family protein [Candidatus Saccharibacteria bacterium]|nr:TVP38/TMEM64 family protein [Candidatus Saccharibacteria bacterium]